MDENDQIITALDPYSANAERIRRRYPTRPASPEAITASTTPAGKFYEALFQDKAQKLKTLPERAIGAASTVPEGKEYDPGPALELSNILMNLQMPIAPQGSAGVFGGKLARGADLQKLNKAEGMTLEGQTPERVWRETGWFEGPTKEWRFEIPDTEAVHTTPRSEQGHNLSDLLQHPRLYEHYPELRDLRVRLDPDASPNTGGLTKDVDSGQVYPKSLDMELAPTRVPFEPGQEPRSVFFHELQHALQHAEHPTKDYHPAWNPGVMGWLVDEYLKTKPHVKPDWRGRNNVAYNLYRKQGNEVEARNSGKRAQYPEFSEIYPLLTEDLARNQIINPPSEFYGLTHTAPLSHRGDAVLEYFRRMIREGQ